MLYNLTDYFFPLGFKESSYIWLKQILFCIFSDVLCYCHTFGLMLLSAFLPLLWNLLSDSKAVSSDRYASLPIRSNKVNN